MNTEIKTNAELMEIARGFQPAAVLTAAAELDVFTIPHTQPMDASRLNQRIKAAADASERGSLLCKTTG